jgi:hypothetical protein
MKKQFFSLTLVSTFRRLAFGLLALFSPLYIFRLIFNISSIEATIRMGIIGVLGYVLLFCLVKILTFPLAENLSFKFGFKNVIALSFIPFFLYITFLILSEEHLFFLILSAFFGGLQAGLFWFAYHGMFVKAVNEHSFGFHEGICQGLGVLTLLISPILGSLLIFFFGFTSLFLTATFLVLLAALALIFAARDKPFHDARFLTSFTLFKKRPQTFFAYLCWGGETSLYGNLWPIFLILILGDILSYGGIITIGILFSVLATFLIGHWVDKAKGSKVLVFGIILAGFTWLLRIMAYFPLLIIFVDGFYRLSEQMRAIPMDVFSYKKAVGGVGGTSQALYFREIALNLGTFLFLSLASFMIFFGLPFWSIFILAFLGTLTPFLVVKKV